MPTRRVGVLCLVVLVSILLAAPVGDAAAQPDDGLWKAGAARVDVTPDEPIWMAGYGSRDHPAEGTLHPIWVKALALEDAAGERGVLITSDLLGFPKALSVRITDRIEEAYGLGRERVMLTSSHTHSGPVLNTALQDVYPVDERGWAAIARYTRHLEDQIVELVGSALRALEPARVSAGTGVTRFAVNRRNNRADELETLTELAGPSDHSVPVLKVEGAGGQLLAVVFGYACHATVLNDYQWSGDYPGFAQIELERAHPGATALFFAGAGADQNPLPRRTAALAEQYGRELAAAVDRVLQEPMEALEPRLRTSYAEVRLGLSTPPGREELRRVAENSSGYEERWARRLLGELEQGRTFRTSYPYPVQVWRLGDQTLAALGGEVVVDYAVGLKRLLGRDLFVIAYANDVMGYIPSVRVLREGGYEGAGSQRVYGLPSTWTADLEQKIISEVLRLAERVGAAPPESELD